MRRLLTYLITTVPFLAAPSLKLSGTALAAEFTPLEVTEILSKSYAADARCRFLHSTEHDELRRYVTHATLAAAELEGQSRTRTVLDRGRSSGEAAECSQAMRHQTISTLAAARRAMAAVGTDEETPNQSSDVVSLPLHQKAPGEDLGIYERHMAAYLTELRCRHLSNRQAKNFWTVVVEEHKAALGKFGVEAVGLAKTRAQSFSSYQQCSPRSEEFVRDEYRDLAGH